MTIRTWVAIGVDAPDVAGPVEAIRGHRPARGLRVVPVAGQRRRAPHLDLDERALDALATIWVKAVYWRPAPA